MAQKVNSALIFSAIFVLFLVASYSEVVYPEALCERASQTWTGKCQHTDHCDNQCIQWENARHGACHKRGGNWKCFCYFDHC
ncbi:hypothetical protein DCAR_0933285 [Daucus carota subsp. sativus]|uniref:Knottins-like domain-containing protein n=1 Tax=Daucus carota subsp. sativus TaxID=79200 RepID=A0AAF1BBQ3_DAUCS|nr:hypothetical protein DCAR_0933285 [Daucus carota subsp. sativus]